MCVSTEAVSNLNMKPSKPRAGGTCRRLRDTQTVSETTTESVRGSFALREMIVSKFGDPISSSNSQRN
jgi:hypothetical protein